jgi:hypothetical protein
MRFMGKRVYFHIQDPDSQGMWIGELQEDISTVSDEAAEYYARKHCQPSIPTQLFGASILCELVAISRGYAREILWDQWKRG